ncbi:MAG TPA: DNA-binding transcriptional regulator [Opitutaceae bacterium]
MKTAPKIALLVETSREYGRGILRGVIRYQHEHEPWSIYFKPQGLGARPPPWLNAWRGDGILARINDRPMARALSSTSVPVVDLRNALPDLNLPTVAISNQTVVRLAVEHFLEQGFRRFAFCGTPRGENRNQDDRCALFESLVKAKGFHCHTYEHPAAPFRSWDAEQRHVAGWLKSLPTPIAVMTCHDDRGQQVIDACLRAGLAVPDEVAILGVDNDPFLCNLSTPQLSSIDVYPERIGYEAAALLHRLMKGGRPPKKPLLFDPRGLVVRRSTDVTAVSDPHVAQVSRLIRDNAAKPVSIEQLLADIPVSRSALFRRFKEHLGRSPKKELSRVRMERAKALLTNSSLSVEEIARQTFQTDSKHFISVFRRATGTTPMVYRRQRAYHQL